MSKYIQVARQVQRLIREKKLRPGDRLPSERALAAELKVAHGTIRLAHDYLFRQGVLDRHHGRGTFVLMKGASSDSDRSRRLGLLYIDLPNPELLSLQEVIFDAQAAAAQADFELIVECMETEDLLYGKLPEMIRKRSIRGVAAYGRVKDYHVNFLEDQMLPYIVLGNRPVQAAVPQARIDYEAWAYQLTRELLKMGKKPVWYDVDPENTRYAVTQEVLGGYARAVREFGDGVLHPCPIRAHHMMEAARMLADSDLSNGAIVVENWSAPLLNPVLATQTRSWRDLLVVPHVPQQGLDTHRQVQGPNVAGWSGAEAMTPSYATLGMQSLIDAISGTTTEVRSVTMEPTITLAATSPSVRLNLQVTPRFFVPRKIAANETMAEQAK